MRHDVLIRQRRGAEEPRLPRAPSATPALPTDWAATAALLDDLGGAGAARRREAIHTLRWHIPHLARTGHLDQVRRVVRALESRAVRSADRDIDELLTAIAASEDVVGSVVDAVADGSMVASVAALDAFLQALRPEALIPLLPRCTRPSALASALRGSAAAIIASDPDAFAALMRGEADAERICAAMGVVGEHRVRAAEPAVLYLLRRRDARVRRAAVGAALLLRNEALLGALLPLLDDADPDVRIETARGLGALRYRPAARRLATIVRGARLRGAELSEKRVFFDACGRMGAPESVQALAHVLSGKRMVLLREGPETRASAARALARARSGAARRALVGARDASDEVVRKAVRHALARIMRSRAP